MTNEDKKTEDELSFIKKEYDRKMLELENEEKIIKEKYKKDTNYAFERYQEETIIPKLEYNESMLKIKEERQKIKDKLLKKLNKIKDKRKNNILITM